MFKDDRAGSQHQGLTDFDRAASIAVVENQNLLGEDEQEKKKTARGHLLTMLESDDALKEAAHFDQPGCKCCSSRGLLVWRILVFVPCFTIICLNTYGNWKGSIYYESEWGFIGSTMSVLFSLLAHFSKRCNRAALLSSEISMAFNMVIVIIFWGILAPQIYQAIVHPKPNPPLSHHCSHKNFLKFQCTVQWYIFEMLFVHSIPMINSVVELLATKMVFLRRDAKWAFLAGIIYMFCDYWGYIVTGHHAVYEIPWLNWADPKWHSWLGYGLQAPVLAAFVWMIAACTQKKRGFKNGQWINKEFDDEDQEITRNTSINAKAGNTMI